MKNRGEIVEKAIRESGVNLTKLAKMIGYNRKSIYAFFEKPDLSLDVIVKIGKVIKYDFRKDFPELFIHDTSMIVLEPQEQYPGSLAECLREKSEWRDKYYTLLEENSQLKSELLTYRK